MSDSVDLERVVRRQEEHIKELERTVRRRDERIRELEKKMRRKEETIRSLESAADQHRRKIAELTSQVDQYQSVMTRPSGSAPPSISTDRRRMRAVGISGESAAPQTENSDSEDKLPKRIAKSSSSRKLLQAAIEANEFLNHLSNEHIETIVDYMYSKDVRKGDVIIREGETGSHIYVLEEGEVEVSKGKQRLRSLGPKTVFGELAILYNCTRTASIKALTNCRIWAIDRKLWQAVTIRIEQRKRTQCLKLLKKVPILNSHSDQLLGQIADRLDEEKYDSGQFIVRQGAKGETFYLVKTGTVLETRRDSSERHSKVIRTLKTGDFFGEKALENEESRKFNYVAGVPDGAVCLILEREGYRELIDRQSNGKRASMDSQILRQMSVTEGLEFPELSPEDVTVVGPIGFGGFSRVELVQLKGQTGRSFALKTLTKHHIVETKQEQHTLNERDILAECNSDFIVRLHATMKDETYLYLLLESCLGGELFTVLKNNGALPEDSVRFYAGCVLEALQYLHSKGIVYRDLKPENLMLDNKGYLKLTDFGFAKKIGGRGQKTWTFCGTPEYIAPEIILNRGHDTSVDLWAYGVLLFELLVGRALFAGGDQMQTYQLVLKGVEAVDFPREVKKKATNLIKKLCRDSATDRLGSGKGGASDVRRNKWFDGFNWEALRNRTLAPPVTPQIRSPTDLSNFENSSPGSEDIPPDYEESVDWDPDF